MLVFPDRRHLPGLDQFADSQPSGGTSETLRDVADSQPSGGATETLRDFAHSQPSGAASLSDQLGKLWLRSERGVAGGVGAGTLQCQRHRPAWQRGIGAQRSDHHQRHGEVEPQVTGDLLGTSLKWEGSHRFLYHSI